MPRPKTIQDFFGFPQALFDMQYPAPGLPGLAEEVADVVHPEYVGADHDSWGLDHGTWSVLVHAFPDADIPVVQLSINAQKPPDYHLELRSEEHTSELQSLMRNSYAVFCLKKKTSHTNRAN